MAHDNSFTWISSNTDQDDESKHTFTIGEDANTWLKGLKINENVGKVNIITVFGVARSGKSTFMNLLNGDGDEVFPSDEGDVSFTQGLHVSKKVQSLQEFTGDISFPGDMFIMLTDSEGTGHKPSGYDILLGLPPLVISNVSIFMIKNSPQPQLILEKLTFLADARKRIENSSKLGHLHVIVRKSGRKLNDDIHNFIFGEEKTNDAGYKERNQMREALKDTFASIHSWETLDVWLPSEAYDNMDARVESGKGKGLRLSDFNDHYHKFFNEFKIKVGEQCREPRALFDFQFSDPETNALVMEKLVEGINQSNDAEFTLSFFDSIQKHRITEERKNIMEELFNYQRKTIEEWKSKSVSLPSKEDAMKTFTEKQSQLLDIFDNNVRAFKKCFVDPEKAKLEEKVNFLRVEYINTHTGLQLPELDDDFKEFLNVNGLQFMEKDLRETEVTSKALFFKLRKDPETLNKVSEGKNSAKKELLTDAVYMGKTFEEKVKTFQEAKEFYSGIIAEAQAMEAKVSGLNKTQLDDQDAEVKKGIESIRNRLNARHKHLEIPDTGLETAKLKEQMAKIAADINEFNAVLVNTKEIPDCKLVDHFSLSRGYLFEKNGSITQKQKVFKHLDAEILYDNSESASSKSLYFSSESYMQTRKSIVDSAGKSFGLTANVSFAGMGGSMLGAFSVSAGVASTSEKESATTSDTKATTSSVFTLKIEDIPMGKLIVDRSQIVLDPDLVEKLEKIKDYPNEKEQNEKLLNFIDTYGSHVCPEVILGGQLTDTSEASFKSALTQFEKEQVISERYDFFISGGGFMVGAAGMGQAGVDGRGINTWQRGERSSGAVSNNQVDMSISRTIHGGDKLAPRPMWKESLLYNSNYAVLDRCYDQAIGIWDLLPDHLSSLRSKYKMTYLNMYFNSGKPWISSLTEIVEKIRLDHFESNKNKWIDQILKDIDASNEIKKFPSNTPYSADEKNMYLESFIRPYLEENIYETIINEDWNAGLTMKRLYQNALNKFRQKEVKEWENKLKIFFRINAKQDTTRREENILEFRIVDHWQKYDSRFASRKWPRGAQVTLNKIHWGHIEYGNAGFSYSNNRNVNAGGPEAFWADIQWTASQKALLEAGFKMEEMEKSIMFDYDYLAEHSDYY